MTAPTEPTDETFVASDGYRWHYRRYLPGTAPLAEVVCVHGIQSHAGWYGHSCRRLAEAGFAVSFLERRGSGENKEARGDTPGFRRLVDDLAEYLHHLGRATLRFIVAISWGGKLAVALQRRHPGLVDGLALLCPGFYPKMGLSLRQRLGIAWARLVQPSRLFRVPLDEPELFTATPKWLDFLRSDLLALHQATARFLMESVRLDGYLRWVPPYVVVPTLLMLGGCDRIIDNARTRAFVERFAGPKDVIEYPDAHHTLEFEPNPELFIGDLVQWLRGQSLSENAVAARFQRAKKPKSP